MVLYTPRNIPWRPVTGYETIEAFYVPEQPLSNQDPKPCYVPDGLITTPVKFPSIITGFQRGPEHVARAALATRHDCQKWDDNVHSLKDEASKSLGEAIKARQKLESAAKELEKSRAQQSLGDKETIAETLKKWKERIDLLSGNLKVIVSECKYIQDRKRDLQFYGQNIEAPLQISHDCLRYREARHKSELANDEVEQLLIKESEVLRQNRKKLDKCLDNCDTQLLQARKMQNDLENFIRTIQYVTCVDKSDVEVLKLAQSNSKEEYECLLKLSNATKSNLQHFEKQVESEINGISRENLKIWAKTNDGFDKRCKKLKEIISTFTKQLSEIKNEMFNIEKNLKNLKTNKEISGELQRAEDHLKSLLRTKKNLERELSSKKNSLFIDEHKCVTIRKCYAVSIIANYY